MDDKKLHLKTYKDIYAHNCLQPDIHYRLVIELDKYSAMSNVPARFIYKSATNFCTPPELDWAMNLQKQLQDGMYGLIYSDSCANVEDRMMGLAGLFIRNFVDARIYTVQFLLDTLASGEEIDGRILLIPNFFVMKSMGGSLPAWKISSLLGFLMERYSKGLPTVLYVQDLKSLGDEYGKAFKDHIENHYLELTD